MKKMKMKRTLWTNLLLTLAFGGLVTARPAGEQSQRPSAEDIATFVIEVYDVSGEGLVNEAELAAALVELHDQRPKRQGGNEGRSKPDHALAAQRVFALGDANADGQLNTSELVDGLKAFHEETLGRHRQQRSDQRYRSE